MRQPPAGSKKLPPTKNLESFFIATVGLALNNQQDMKSCIYFVMVLLENLSFDLIFKIFQTFKYYIKL